MNGVVGVVGVVNAVAGGAERFSHVDEIARGQGRRRVRPMSSPVA
ncbi:hypothetical protein [Streptomyces sp. NPDC088196]